ncbi:hypothetical protein MRB53_023096 [Persea americana]|uniref:Uncharacterized protein n=1 Tax=Persea americana TaxID=3435 RepID=A0ACC2L9P7_PERAE|nr:hypothetical protein MRB53_023096 [Persea americana]
MEDFARKIWRDSTCAGDGKVGRQRGGWQVSSSFTLPAVASSEMMVWARGWKAFLKVEKVDCYYLIEGVKLSLMKYDTFHQCIDSDVDISIRVISNSSKAQISNSMDDDHNFTIIRNGDLPYVSVTDLFHVVVFHFIVMSFEGGLVREVEFSSRPWMKEKGIQLLIHNHQPPVLKRPTAALAVNLRERNGVDLLLGETIENSSVVIFFFFPSLLLGRIISHGSSRGILFFKIDRHDLQTDCIRM